jgi:predicted NBD/HSP70 family sugar kinase
MHLLRSLHNKLCSLCQLLSIRGRRSEERVLANTGSPALLRQLNTDVVLRAIRKSGRVSRADLRRMTSLSRPTINEVVEELLNGELVSELQEDAASRGSRPGPTARLLRFRAERGHLLAIDIGAESTLLKIADLDGSVLEQFRLRSHPFGDLFELIQKWVDASLVRVGSEDLTPRQVVIATPGVVDPTNGHLRLAPQLEGLNATPLVEVLGFDCPTVVENEMHMAVLGEQWKGAAQGAQDIVYLGLGVGISAGIMLQGKIYRGASGSAGEIGYLPLTKNLDFDNDPKNGPGAFEAAAGAQALAALGEQAASSSRGRGLLEFVAGDASKIDASVVSRAAQAGDPTAISLIDQHAAMIARGVASLALVLNPAVVIIGGGLSQAGDTLLVPLKLHLRSLLPEEPPDLVIAKLGDESAAFGALRLAVNLNDERIYANPVTGAAT